MNDSKTCERCGETFYRKRGIPPSKFATRKYCSTACSGRSTLVPGRGAPKQPRLEWPKTCNHCNREFYQRDNEPKSSFLRRKTCCIRCARAQSSENRVDTEYVPTHKEVWQAAAEIRAGWTPEERAMRARWAAPVSWTVPETEIIYNS